MKKVACVKCEKQFPVYEMSTVIDHRSGKQLFLCDRCMGRFYNWCDAEY
jgi:NAD-dependent SIR2 family protein deacetylase